MYNVGYLDLSQFQVLSCTQSTARAFNSFSYWRNTIGQVLSFVRDFSASAQPTVTTSLKFWEDCGVRWMEKCFENQFLNLEVPAIKSALISIKKIEQDLLDTQILLELGNHAEISVSHYREFLSRTTRSTNQVFIAYLRGVSGNLCSVSAHRERGQRGG